MQRSIHTGCKHNHVLNHCLKHFSESKKSALLAKTWRSRSAGVVRSKRAGDGGERLRREFEERLKELALGEEVLKDEQMQRSWEEMQQAAKDFSQKDISEKEKAQENMEDFLRSLFRNLSRSDGGDYVRKDQVEEIFSDLPPELVEKMKERGVWDRLPNAGFYPGALDDLKLWTEEEYEVFNEDPHLAPSLDEDEEVRKELLLLSAVRKLEDFFSTYPDDPAEVLNMMVAAKMAVEAKRDPFSLRDTTIDDVDEDMEDESVEDLIDIDGIEECLKDLEEGEDAPPPDPEKTTIIQGDTAENFLQRMELLHDYYEDPRRSRENRKLSKAEYNEIRNRWKQYMPDKEPLFFQDINHIRLAPNLPSWMEPHFRSLQHITYILRAAHINAKITEPGKRLKKYDRISPDITYTDPAIEIEGFDAFLSHMTTLEDAGFTTEPNAIFGDVMPPKERFEDREIENPWSYTIIVDQHLNMPIPEWYHATLDAYESKMTEEDLVQDNDEFLDSERYRLADSMDRIVKQKEKIEKPAKEKNKRPTKLPHPSEVADAETKKRFDDLKVGLKEGNPELYDPIYVPERLLHQKKDFSGSGKVKGDFWYGGPICSAWKDGYMITINVTLLYKLDIVAGQVSEIQMRWGAILGSVLAAEDAEKIFCEASGVKYEDRKCKHDFVKEWKEYEYKPIRKDPVQWFKQNVMGMKDN